jgi:hypothetical protein
MGAYKRRKQLLVGLTCCCLLGFSHVFGIGRSPKLSRVVTREMIQTIPKLFEKLVYDEITPIIRPSLSAEQHGRFCSLVEFSHFVLSEVEDERQIDAVCIDFSKAFYRVNHGLLLGTLTLKFRRAMIFWMSSLLRNDLLSLSDVPQGWPC